MDLPFVLGWMSIELHDSPAPFGCRASSFGPTHLAEDVGPPSALHLPADRLLGGSRRTPPIQLMFLRMRLPVAMAAMIHPPSTDFVGGSPRTRNPTRHCLAAFPTPTSRLLSL